MKSTAFLFKIIPLGLGRTHPDPKGDLTLPDGVVIPKGKGCDSGVTGSSLLYNEYPLTYC